MEAALRGSGLQLRITAQGSFSVEPAPHDAQALQCIVVAMINADLAGKGAAARAALDALIAWVAVTGS